ncbi:MAG: MqnA/MqnD/SBP family protein [Bacteroidota bacterium]
MALFKNFSVGIDTYKEAHRLIVKHKLWWYVIVPGIINIVLFASVLILGVHTSRKTIDWLFDLLGITGNEEGFLHYLYSVLTFVLRLIIQIIFILVYMSIYKYLVLIIMSPLLAVLADKTSRLITGRKVPYTFRQLMKDVWRGMLLVFRNIFIEIFFIVVCFFIGYIPVIKFACPVFLFLLSMYFYGFSMIYFSNECYRLKINQSVRFVRRNNGFAIANGLIFYGMLIVPVIGILAAPAYAVVAATIGVNKIMKQEEEQNKKATASSQKNIRISAVSYLNTLPFVYGLKYSGLLENYDLKLDVPSMCAKKFEEGEADIALVPSGALPQLKNYRLIPDFCIGSNGNVKTVLLLTQVPLIDIRRIYLDQHSLTSVHLIKILALNFWKIYPEWISPDDASQNNMTQMESIVAIGDKTFLMAENFKHVYDLSDEWFKFTGLPFVFACWIAREDLPAESLLPFINSLKWGLSHKNEAIETLFHPSEFPGIGIHEYLNKNIDFNFDDQKHKALCLFLEYIRNI